MSVIANCTGEALLCGGHDSPETKPRSKSLNSKLVFFIFKGPLFVKSVFIVLMCPAQNQVSN